MSYIMLSITKPCQTLTLGILKVLWVCDGVDVDTGQWFRVTFCLTYCILLIIVAFAEGMEMGKIKGKLVLFL